MSMTLYVYKLKNNIKIDLFHQFADFKSIKSRSKNNELNRYNLMFILFFLSNKMVIRTTNVI